MCWLEEDSDDYFHFYQVEGFDGVWSLFTDDVLPQNNLCIEPILLYALQHLEIAMGLENNIDKCQALS